ncbi:MAG: hypothetical protein ABIP08_03375 [Lautropia sp.]
MVLDWKFGQVQYLSLTGHVYSPSAIIINPGVFRKPSAADKAVK